MTDRLSFEEAFGGGQATSAPVESGGLGSSGAALTPTEDRQSTYSFEEAFGDSQPVDATNSTEENKLSFAQRFGKDLFERQKMAEEIIAASAEGEQSWGEGILQLVGKVGAGGTLDMIGEGLVSGGRGLSAITPDIIENPVKDSATAAAHMFLDTTPGRAGLYALEQGVEAWEEWKQEHPRAARNIESVVNVGMLATPVGRAEGRTGQTAIGRSGDAFLRSADDQVTRSRREFVDDLVTPKQTTRVRESQVPRTTVEGPLRSKRVTLSRSEQSAAKEVNKIESVTPKNTLQENYNIISQEARSEARNLKTKLQKDDFSVPADRYRRALQESIDKLNSNPLLVGDSQKVATGLAEKMMEKIGKRKNVSGSFLLNARKELDKIAISNKGEKIFDPNLENALSVALREIRQTTNDFIEANAPNIGVRNSLRKQSNLLTAAENIAPKAAQEEANALLRAWGNVKRLLPLRGEFNQSMAALMGVGGLGAAASFAPWFTKLAAGLGAAYVGGRIITSPAAKRVVGELLKKIDAGIRKTNDADLVRQLRADRAMIYQLHQNMKTDPNFKFTLPRVASNGDNTQEVGGE